VDSRRHISISRARVAAPASETTASRNPVAQRGLFLAVAAVSLLGGGAAVPTFGEEAPARRETFSVQQDATALRRVADVQEYIDKKRWDEAADMLIRLTRERGKSLIALRNGWSVNLAWYCHVLVSTLPAEGLKAYREKIDRRAKSWLEDARKTGSDPPLRRILREAFCSSSGDEALLALGQSAWEKGDLITARQYWRQLLPPESTRRAEAENAEKDRETRFRLHYPDSNIEPALIRARLIVCDIMQRNFKRADRLLAAFAKRHPEATGRIAGRDGRLVEILPSVRNEEQRWEVSRDHSGFPTFAGNAARNVTGPELVDVGVPRWSRNLLWKRVPTVDFPVPGQTGRHPACFPVVSGGKVFLANAHTIYGYRLKDGSPAFPVGEIEGRRSAESKAALYSISADGSLPAPTEPSIGVPYFTLTVDKDRLFARLGSPITGRSKEELRAVRSRLVCLDLDRGGDLAWMIESRSLGAGWEFDGTPLADAGRLYVVMRKRLPELEVHVGCFDAASGKPIWRTSIGTAITAGGEGENVLSHVLLTAAGGRLFLCTGLGAVAALDQRDGLLEWTVTYPTVIPKERRLLSDPERRGFGPCLFHRGTIYAAPDDADHLTALDAATGGILWRRRLRGGVRHLLGVRDGCLIVSGDRLWGLKAVDGSVRWNVGYRNPAGHGFGRGALAGDRVLWPLRREVLVVSTETGRLTRRIALTRQYRGQGGNVTLVKGGLIVTEPDRVVVYGNRPGMLNAP